MKPTMLIIGGGDISNDFQVSGVGTRVVMSFFMAGNRGSEREESMMSSVWDMVSLSCLYNL